MGIRNRDGALYVATGFDNSGFYAGKREVVGIIKAMMGEITSFDVFSGIGISAATAFAQAAKSSYDFEREFRKNMLEVATISTQVTDDMTGFMNQVVSITQEIPVTAPEAAKALYQIVSAGHDGADGMRVLEVSARSAIGGMTDTATAADAITTLLNAYKLGAADAEKVSDQLFTTARLGKTTFGELGQSIAQVAPIAASYGVEMDQVLAAVATLTKSGVPTAQAMTQIRASIIGVSKVLGDGAFNTRTYQEALAEVATMAGGSESKLRELIPEVEAVNGVLGMTGIKARDAASHLAEMNASAGATETAFNQMMDDVGKQMTLLSNNIQAALRPMGDAILKNVSEAAKAINNGFETGDMENGLENMRKLLLGVAGAYLTYKSSAIGAFAVEALGSAKVAISNNLRLLQNQITGESILAKEKERVSQEAYTTSLERTLTEEQRAKLSKLDLKAGSQEYMRALADQASQEKRNADNLVESLTKQVAKGKERLASAGDNLDMSRKALGAAKAEMDAAIKSNDSVAFEIAQTKLNSAAKREEAAMTNVSAAKKKLRANESRLLTATTVAEAAATRMNMATTAADTAMTNVATTAKSRLRIATMALWQAMKANPLGMILTMVSFATTAYMLFADKIKVAETAQDRLNKLNRAAAESVAAETAELDMLLSIAKNELAARSEREKAIKRLNEISPEYLGNLSLENIKTREATESIDAYTKAIGRNAKSKALMDEMNPLYREQLRLERELYDLQKKSDDLRENKLNLSDEQLRYANLDISAQIKNKESQKGEVDKEIQDVLDMYNKELSNEARRDPVKVDIPVHIQLEAEQANLSALMSKKEEIEARIKEKEGKVSLVDALDLAELGTVNNELKKTSDLLASLGKETSGNAESEGSTILERKIDLTKKLSEAEANLRKLRDPGSKATENNITEAENKVKEIKGKLEALTGLSTKDNNTLQSEQSDRLRAIEDYRKSISEAGVQAELAIRQQGIEAMDEGSKKELAMIHLNYDRLRDANRKRANEMIRERQELERKQWEYDNPKWKEKGMTFKPATTKVDQLPESQQKQLLAYDEIARQANKKAEEDYQRSLLDRYQDYTDKRLAIEKRYNDDIAALQEERKKAVASGDTEKVERIDRSTAQATKDKGQELMGHDYERLKQTPEYVRAFENLKRTSSETLRSLLSQLENAKRSAAQVLSPDQLREYTSTIQDIMDELDSRNPFQSLSDKKEELAQAERDLADAQTALETAKRQAEDVRGGAKVQSGVRITGLDKKTKQVTSEKVYLSEAAALDKVKAATDRYNKAKDNVTDKNAKVRDSEKEVRSQIDKLAKSMSEVGDAIGGPAGEIISLIGEIGSFTMMAMNGIQAAADTSAQAISTVEKASVILAIISTAIQIAMKIASLFNGDKKHEKKIEALKGQVEDLERAYERLGRTIENTYSSEVYALMDRQEENLRRQQELIRQQMREEEAKKNTDDGKMREYQDRLDEIDNQIEDSNRKQIEMWAGTDIQSAIDDFADALVEAYAQGEDGAKAMADTTKKLLANAVKEALKKKFLGDALQGAVTQLGKDMEDGNLSDADKKRFEDSAKAAGERFTEAMRMYDDLFKETEDDIKDGVSGQLQAAMTEGTASQLVGLWNSTAIDMRELKQISMVNGETVSSILSEVSEIMRQSILIEQNTRRGADNTDGLIDELRDGFTALDDRLSEIERNTRTTKSRG